jgi:hypothetical protein
MKIKRILVPTKGDAVFFDIIQLNQAVRIAEEPENAGEGDQDVATTSVGGTSRNKRPNRNFALGMTESHHGLKI